MKTKHIEAEKQYNHSQESNQNKNSEANNNKTGK
jgi:hypothetical protein